MEKKLLVNLLFLMIIRRQVLNVAFLGLNSPEVFLLIPSFVVIVTIRIFFVACWPDWNSRAISRPNSIVFY